MPEYGDGNKWPLIIFIVICAINTIALGFDEALRGQGMPTITDQVRRCPILGVPIVLLQMIGTIALAFHLWVSHPVPR